ncbi:P-loop containing nucleoside triphosphate hydrolase protein [Hypoxylon sp. FL1284]|nr:P-loop containing nucleoside triphosphate hydrolase protein [Hypoxylon sp. FL1284]
MQEQTFSPPSAKYVGRLFPQARKESQQNEHVGKECSVQRFYEEGTLGGSITWNDFASPALANPRKIKYEGAAFQVYNRLINTRDKITDETRDRFADDQHGSFNSVREYYVSKIIIQSPFIRASLEKTFTKYGLNYTSDKTAHSHWPHRALYFSRDKIAEVARNSPDEQTRQHCTLLGIEIETALEDVLEELRVLHEKKEITFRLLWTLLPQGSIFGTESSNCLRAFRVKDYLLRVPARLVCECICFDGFRYGTLEYEFDIDWFEGRLAPNKIPDLPIFNVSPGRPMRARLIERGKKILNFQDIHYAMHIPSASNVVSEDNKSLKPSPSSVKTGDPERVVIDFSLYQKHVDRIEVEPLRAHSLQSEEPDTEDRAQTRMKVLAEDREHRRPNAAEQEQNRKQVLENEENLILLHPKLEGFSLATSKWARFEVDHIHPINFDPNIFQYVVHDKRTKDLLRVLVESHQEKVHKYDEFIEGKGDCLLILLTGESGTGKTLMAESIADHLEKPLIRFTPADDTVTVVVEKTHGGNLHTGYSGLSDAIQVAADWGAIMLYDDANFENESFLYTFLRQVEYFKGIVFFTSNSELFKHPAVLSRAQIHLRFRALTPEMRRQIWSSFNARLPDDVGRLGAPALDKLSTWQMNGRQIKNAVNMTVSWCRKTKERLSLDTVEDVIRLTCPSAVAEAPEAQSSDLLNW